MKPFVYDQLTRIGLPYTVVEHPAVFTIADMQQLDFPANAVIAKNLLLRNAKGDQHYLLVVDADQQIDVKALKEKLGSTRLSFVSEERLHTYLGLAKGAVSPFGLLNDPDKHVTVYLDQALDSERLIGVHPNDNTATVFLTFADLIKFIAHTDHQVHLLNF